MCKRRHLSLNVFLAQWNSSGGSGPFVQHINNLSTAVRGIVGHNVQEELQRKQSLILSMME